MLKSRLYEYLKHYLGEYLYGLEQNQLQVAVLSGQIDFSNANFRPSKVNDLLLSLGLPISLKAGCIGRLRVRYHYLSLLSNPIEVLIEDLILVLGPILPSSLDDKIDTFASDEELSAEDALKPPGNTVETTFSEEDLRLEDLQIANLNSEFVSGRHRVNATLPPATHETENQPKTRSSALPACLLKALKTLTLVINRVHIRYEDDIYPYQTPFSLGVSFDSVSIQSESTPRSFLSTSSSELTVDKPANTSDTYKTCVLKHFSVYLNPLCGMVIPTSLWEATVNSPIGIFDALPAFELRELLIQETELSTQLYSLISPVSLTGFIRLKEKGVAVSLSLPLLPVQISSDMVRRIKGFIDYVDNVKIWGYLRRFRPAERLAFDHQIRTLNRKKIARKWFLYALRFIKYRGKLRFLTSNKTAENTGKVPKWLIDCEVQVRVAGLKVTISTETAEELKVSIGHIGGNFDIRRKKISGDLIVGEVEVRGERCGVGLSVGRKYAVSRQKDTGSERELALECAFAYTYSEDRPGSLRCYAEGTVGSLVLCYSSQLQSLLSHLSHEFFPVATSRKTGKSGSFRSNYIRIANRIDQLIATSSVSLVFKLGEVYLKVYRDDMDSLCEWHYVSSPLRFTKDKSRTQVSALGLTLTTKSTFSVLVSFLTVISTQSVRHSVGSLFP